MSSIAGVTVEAFSFPSEDQAALNRSIGAAWDGSRKGIEYAAPTRQISIHLTLIELTTKDNLYAALIAATDYIVAIVPPTNINYGNGAGTSVNAQWLDDTWRAWQDAPGTGTWNVDLTFIYVS
jgi:hypothetical protein